MENLKDLQIIRQQVEKSSINWGKDLQRNDLLFIDSSHIIRPQGDVLFEYLEIIPELSKGVLVHVHDIFTPYDYPNEWIKKIYFCGMNNICLRCYYLILQDTKLLQA